MAEVDDINGKVAFVNLDVVQWMIRAAFEEGSMSNHETWRDDWMKSKMRAMMIKSGLVSGKDGYK